MRITHRMLVRTALRDLSNSTQRLGKYMEQLSSGKRIRRPSDDPFAVARVLDFRSELQALEVSKRNIALGRDWLGAMEATIDKTNDMLIRAKGVALRGSDDSVGQEARQAMAAEAAQLLGSALQSANTGSQGHYLFAGYKISQVPFTGLDAGGNATEDPDSIVQVVYHGDNGSIVREVEPGVTMEINLTGEEPWLNPDPANAGSMFNIIIDLRDALAAGDADAVRQAADRLDGAITNVTRARGVVGAKLQRLTLAEDKLASVTLGLEDLISQTENVDMAEAMVNYSQQEAMHRAALQANSKSLPVSLLDFLR